MTIEQAMPILWPCTLSFLLFVVQFPTAISQEITFTEEPKDNYHIVNKIPVTISCAARHAVDISFTCGGVKVQPASMELEDILEDNPEVVKASITVTFADVTSFKKNESYWCECNAIGIDGAVGVTSKRGVVTTDTDSNDLAEEFSQNDVSSGAKSRKKRETVKPPYFIAEPEAMYYIQPGEELTMVCDVNYVIIVSFRCNGLRVHRAKITSIVPKGFHGNKLTKTRLKVMYSEVLDFYLENGMTSVYQCKCVGWQQEGGTWKNIISSDNVGFIKLASPMTTTPIPEMTSEPLTTTTPIMREPYLSVDLQSVYYVTRNKNVTLECAMTGVDEISLNCPTDVKKTRRTAINQYILDGNLVQMIEYNMKGTVTLSHVEEGSYNPPYNYSCFCKGHADHLGDGGDIYSQTTLVKIAYLRRRFQNEGGLFTIEEGKPLNLTCIPPQGDPLPEVSWQKDLEPLQKDLYSGRTLIIEHVDISDGGTYTCVAENIAARRFSEPFQVQVVSPMTTTPIPEMTSEAMKPTTPIMREPYVSVDLQSVYYVTRYKDATLECQMIGVDIISINCSTDVRTTRASTIREYVLDGKTFGEIVYNIEATVTLHDAKEAYYKSYPPYNYTCFCTGHSSPLGLRGYVHSRSTWVKIPYLRPWFQNDGGSFTIEEGKALNLTCIPPEGDPQPEVSWEKDHNPLPKDLYSGKTLIIEHVTMEDAGEYVCVAENIAARKYSLRSQVRVVLLSLPRTLHVMSSPVFNFPRTTKGERRWNRDLTTTIQMKTTQSLQKGMKTV